MRIYIPEHLRRIPIVSDFCTLISEYSSWYEEPATSSFNDYEYYLSNDPVKRFIKECIPEETWDPEGGQDYITVVNYLAKLFYSVKGTPTLVFDYMKKYLNLEFDGEIIYEVDCITFNLKLLNTTDESLFLDLLKEFLSTCLLFSELNVNIAIIQLAINSEITSYITGDVVTYRVHTPIPMIN